jgi:proline racemase
MRFRPLAAEPWIYVAQLMAAGRLVAGDPFTQARLIPSSKFTPGKSSTRTPRYSALLRKGER